MFDDIVCDAKGNDEFVTNDSKTIRNYAERFHRDHWSFLALGFEKKWYGTYGCKPNGSWNRTAEKMLQNFEGSGPPIFHCASALERRIKKQKNGKKSILDHGSTQNIELLLQIVISVNQLGVHGAAATMIEELPFCQKVPGKPGAPGQLEKHGILTSSRRNASQ